MPIGPYLVLSGLLFALGTAGVFLRRILIIASMVGAVVLARKREE